MLPQLNAHLIEVNLSKDEIRAEYDLFITQNFTVFQVQIMTLDGDDVERISTVLEDALQKVEPQVMISNLEIQLIFSEESLNLKFSFYAKGITEKKGNTMFIDCSWKSFTVTDDLMIRDIHFNRFGEAYIRPVLESRLHSSSLRVVVNGTRQIFPEEGINILGNMTILNFASYSQPLDSWERSFFLENTTTIWSLHPDPLINATVTYYEGNISKSHYAVLDHSMRVVVPGMAGAEGNVIKINLGLPSYEIIFSGIIIFTFVFSIVFYVLERRVKKKIVKKRR